MTGNPDLWDPRRGLGVVFDELVILLRRSYAAIAELHEPNRTMLVGHSLSFFTRVFEEKHHVPAATVHLAPSVFRSAFGQPALPSGRDISGWPRWAKRALWWAVDRFAVDPLIAPGLNAWRGELELPPVSRVLKSWLHSPQRVIGLFPEWFGEPQPDWPRQIRLTGFVLSDEKCAPEGAGSGLPAHLEQFLASGDAPIVFTPGHGESTCLRFLSRCDRWDRGHRTPRVAGDALS